MVCLTDDPFDPPGWDRFGGGHLFVFDLGRYLVRLGWRVDYLTRRNAPEKAPYEQLGTRCSVTRLTVGPAEDVPPLALYPYLHDLTVAAREAVATRPSHSVIHSHNWLSGAVALAIREPTARHVHSILSLGRVRWAQGEEPQADDRFRDQLEVDLFRAADVLVTVAPSERDDLRRLYPEIAHDRIAVVPYGVDPDVFYPRPESPDHFVRRQARRCAEGADHSR